MLCIRPWITGTPWLKRIPKSPSILIKLSMLGTSFMKLTGNIREKLNEMKQRIKSLEEEKTKLQEQL